MPSLNSAPLAIQRAPATFSLVVVTCVCFLLFYPLHWVGMLELFNFVPFRAAGGYVAFGEWGDWWRLQPWPSRDLLLSSRGRRLQRR